MRTVVTAATVSILMVAGTIALAAPAQAGERCVSKSEYRAVKEGWTKDRVHRKFDTAGERVSRDRYGKLGVEMRNYRGCGSKYSVVVVTYNKWKGTDPVWRVGPGGKSAVWI